MFAQKHNGNNKYKDQQGQYTDLDHEIVKVFLNIGRLYGDN